MDKWDKGIHIISTFFIILVYLFSFTQNEYVRESFLVSSYAIVGLSYVLFILLIPFLARKAGGVFRELYSRRMWLGIYSFIFIAIHVFLALDVFYSFDLNNLLNSSNLLYITLGTLAFLILAAMTITSNRFSMRKLGRRWKTLHNLVFIALILVLIHSSSMGLYFMNNLFYQIIFYLVSAFVIALKVKYSLLR